MGKRKHQQIVHLEKTMRTSKEQADYPARGYDRWRGKVVAVWGFNLFE